MLGNPPTVKGRKNSLFINLD